jgi:hypothetical protein
MSKDVAKAMDGPELLVEVERYLAAVDAFRAAGVEPTWLPEPAFAEVPPARRRRRRLGNGVQGRTS